MEKYRLDPAQRRRPQVLTRTELRTHVQQLEPYRDIIERGLFELFSYVDDTGYEASFCNREGVTVLNLPRNGGESGRSLECPGSLWIEEAEGTNGIGTCLWEERAVSVFQTEHFLSRYMQNSCAAAPLLSSRGEMLGVFNITTNISTVSAETHGLAFNVLNRIVADVERRLFKHHYREHRLVEMRLAPDKVALVAASEEGALVAADRHARAFLGFDSGSLDGKSLWQYFDRDADFLNLQQNGSATLVHAGSGQRMRSRVLLPSPKPVSRAAADVVMRDAKAASSSLREAAGGDARMQRNIELLERVRDTSLSVLLLGETGTGKDVMARAIHADGPRARKPFVALNCAAMPETLIDSELFGYGAGAFTGAKREGQAGRIVEADGGVLFLDEIGDMPLSLQTRLLRFLENAEVMPVGGGLVRHVDVRVIAATNVSVLQAVKEGRFRADLYYRLAGVVVNLPPLRERGDFETVARKILSNVPVGAASAISDAAMAVLKAHDWPGNIRELRNMLQRSSCFANGGTIMPEHLFFDIGIDAGVAHSVSVAQPNRPAVEKTLPLPDHEWDEEREVLLEALRANGDDVVIAAKSLNISRATFYRRLKDFQIRQRGTRRVRLTAPN